MHPHFPGNVPQDYMPIFQFDSKRSVREVLQNLALHFNYIFFCHRTPRIQLNERANPYL